MTSPSHRTITWMLVSRIAGLVIVFALLVMFLVSSALGKTVDRTVTLAFLTIATGLLGIPAGWYLVRRNGDSSK